MIHSGDTLEHPITRERIVFRKTARDTAGALMQAELSMPPGGFVAAAHIHPQQEERFEVIAGTLHGRIAGSELTAGPGEVVVVPPGTPHVWWNAGDTEMRVLVEARPALRLENFFETFFGLAQDGEVSPKTGLPNPLQMAMTMRAFQNELILARPPRLVQTLLFAPLAVVGKLLGYKAEHPYPRASQPAAPAAQGAPVT
jgi:quercetin dioxygenase-like cupin family protein